MRRTLSFGRRSGRRSAADAEEEGRGSQRESRAVRSAAEDEDEPEAAESSQPETSSRWSGVKKVVRSASFGRRTRGSSRASRGDSLSQPVQAGDEPAESRDPADGIGGGQGAYAYAADTPVPATLSGWLHKKHQHKKSVQVQWAKRYFHVDELRGTLSYAKSEAKKPTVVLPLADVTSVRHCPACLTG